MSKFLYFLHEHAVAQAMVAQRQRWNTKTLLKADCV